MDNNCTAVVNTLSFRNRFGRGTRELGHHRLAAGADILVPTVHFAGSRFTAIQHFDDSDYRPCIAIQQLATLDAGAGGICGGLGSEVYWPRDRGQTPFIFQGPAIPAYRPGLVDGVCLPGPGFALLNTLAAWRSCKKILECTVSLTQSILKE